MRTTVAAKHESDEPRDLVAVAKRLKNEREPVKGPALVNVVEVAAICSQKSRKRPIQYY